MRKLAVFVFISLFLVVGLAQIACQPYESQAAAAQGEEAGTLYMQASDCYFDYENYFNCGTNAESAGDTYKEAGVYQDAMIAYTQAGDCYNLANRKNYEYVTYQKAGAYAEENQDYESAAEYYSLAIDISLEVFPASAERCQLYASLASMQEAMGDEDAAASYGGAADCMFSIREYSQCGKYAASAIDIEPKPEYYEAAGKCYSLPGTNAEYIQKCGQYYQQAAEKYTDHSKTASAYEKAGDCYATGGSPETRQSMYYECAGEYLQQAALTASTDDRTTYFSAAAACYRKAGEYGTNSHAGYLEAYIADLAVGKDVSGYDITALTNNPQIPISQLTGQPGPVSPTEKGDSFFIYVLLGVVIIVAIVAFAMLSKMFQKKKPEEKEEEKPPEELPPEEGLEEKPMEEEPEEPEEFEKPEL